ncbi:MAG: LLM class F420-dependent oxidoreductase, partial [Ilumatobacteraceae bacterium]
MSRLSYHIPNFTYDSGSGSPFPLVVAQAKEAEASGFDRITVMDHFYQLPMLGRPEEP